MSGEKVCVVGKQLCSIGSGTNHVCTKLVGSYPSSSVSAQLVRHIRLLCCWRLP